MEISFVHFPFLKAKINRGKEETLQFMEFFLPEGREDEQEL